MPRPRPSSRTGNGAANKLFVNREGPIAEFWRALDGLSADSSELLVFHGIGGQGKTWLCHELMRQLRASGRTDLVVGNVDLHVRRDINPALALLWIRNALVAGSKRGFPAFDVGYAMYWRACFPEMPLPDFGASGWLAHVDEMAPGILAEGAEGAIDLAAKGLTEILPFGAILQRVAAFGLKKAKLRFIFRRNPILQELVDAEGNPLPALALERRLPDLLAWDIGKLAEQGLRCVIFIDEYERVLEQGGVGSPLRRNLFDDATRQLVACARAALFVICSRERLPWSDQPTGGIDPLEWRDWVAGAHHHLDGLAAADADRFLSAIPVPEADIRAAIIQGSSAGDPGNRSAVYPLMLDMQADHYLRLRADPAYRPQPEDFSLQARSVAELRTHLLQRLLRDYGQQTEALLKRLAVARSFDRRLFVFLERELPCGFPLDGFERITQLSFVEEGPSASPDYVFHRIIREGLLEFIPPEDVRETHEALFRYYSSLAAIAPGAAATVRHGEALIEAAYHKLSSDPDSVMGWWKSARERYAELRLWRPILGVEELLLEKLEDAPGVADEALDTLLGLYVDTLFEVGQFARAIEVLDRLIALLRRQGDKSLSDLAQRLLLQSVLLYRESRPLEAELVGDDAYDLVDRLDPSAALDARRSFYISLSLGLDRQGLVDEAIEVTRKLIACEVEKYGPNHYEVMRSRAGRLAGRLLLRRRHDEVRAELARVGSTADDETMEPDRRIELLVEAAGWLSVMGDAAEARRFSSLALAIHAKAHPNDAFPADRALIINVVSAQRLAVGEAEANATLARGITALRRTPGLARADLAALYLAQAVAHVGPTRVQLVEDSIRQAEQLIEEEGSISRDMLTELLFLKLYSCSVGAGVMQLMAGATELVFSDSVREEFRELMSALLACGGRDQIVQLAKWNMEQLPVDSPARSLVQLGLGYQLVAMGRHAEAEPFITAGYAAARQLFGPGHENLTDALTGAIGCLRALDKRAETQPLIEDLKLFTDRFSASDDPPLSYFVARTTLAEETFFTGDYDSGIAQCDEVLQQLERCHGRDSIHWAVLFINRVALLSLRQRSTMEEVLEACKLARNTLGIGAVLTLQAHAILANSYANLKRWQEAFEARLVQVQCLHMIQGSRAPGTRQAMAQLASHARLAGRYGDARRWYSKAMRALEPSDATIAAFLVTNRCEYSPVLLACGEFSEMLRVAQSVLDLPLDVLPAEAVHRALANFYAARARSAMGDHEAARVQLEAVLRLQFAPEADWIPLGARATLAEAEVALGRTEAGLAHIDAAVEQIAAGPRAATFMHPEFLIRRERLRARAGTGEFDMRQLSATLENYIAGCDGDAGHPAVGLRRIEMAETLALRGYRQEAQEQLTLAVTLLRQKCGSLGSGLEARIDAARRAAA